MGATKFRVEGEIEIDNKLIREPISRQEVSMPSNCDNLWCIHQHTADPDSLPTVALKYIHTTSSNIPTCSAAMLQARVLLLILNSIELTHRTVPQVPHGAGILKQLTKHTW